MAYDPPNETIDLCMIHETSAGRVDARINIWEKKAGEDQVYLDFRRFYLDKNTDRWLPTQKGFSVPLNEEVLDNLEESLRKARACMKRVDQEKPAAPKREPKPGSTRLGRLMTGTTRREREEFGAGGHDERHRDDDDRPRVKSGNSRSTAITRSTAPSRSTAKSLKPIPSGRRFSNASVDDYFDED